jgi:hypothetical protein
LSEPLYFIYDEHAAARGETVLVSRIRETGNLIAYTIVDSDKGRARRSGCITVFKGQHSDMVLLRDNWGTITSEGRQYEASEGVGVLAQKFPVQQDGRSRIPGRLVPRRIEGPNF